MLEWGWHSSGQEPCLQYVPAATVFDMPLLPSLQAFQGNYPCGSQGKPQSELHEWHEIIQSHMTCHWVPGSGHLAMLSLRSPLSLNLTLPLCLQPDNVLLSCSAKSPIGLIAKVCVQPPLFLCCMDPAACAFVHFCKTKTTTLGTALGKSSPMNHGKLQVADFGLASTLTEGQTHLSGIKAGTPLYIAPETLREGRQSRAAGGLH